MNIIIAFQPAVYRKRGSAVFRVRIGSTAAARNITTIERLQGLSAERNALREQVARGLRKDAEPFEVGVPEVYEIEGIAVVMGVMLDSVSTKLMLADEYFVFCAPSEVEAIKAALFGKRVVRGRVG